MITSDEDDRDDDGDEVKKDEPWVYDWMSTISLHDC